MMTSSTEDSQLLTAGAGEAEGAVVMAEHPAWSMLSRLPVRMSVEVPLLGLSVRDLLALRTGQTICSTWAVGEDVPLRAGTQQISWGEFEVVEERMALRLTRLA
jgi:flagellar motor switch/type III secretory pathway protein FliN